MSKKILFTILFLWLQSAMFSAFAQQKIDTVYTFRFVPQKDIFYVPWNGNDTELDRLLACIESNKADILNGKLPLLVDGYCNSKDIDTENLAMAKIRSNRVKSELITRKGLSEHNFITHNHASEGDFVIVRMTIPAKEMAVTEPETRRKAEAEAQCKAEAGTQCKAEAECLEAEDRAEQERQNIIVTDTSPETKIPTDYHLSLRANLLRWVALTPDFGVQWRISPSWGISVSGSWTSWSWNDKDRRYALWEVTPELRYYIGKEKCGYFGAMFKTGQFNYKFSASGKQGEVIGGGLTGGYMLKLNNALSLDFSVGIGGLYTDYEKYMVIDNVRVHRGSEYKNYWGINHLGVSLIWNIF